MLIQEEEQEATTPTGGPSFYHANRAGARDVYSTVRICIYRLSHLELNELIKSLYRGYDFFAKVLYRYIKDHHDERPSLSCSFCTFLWATSLRYATLTQ